MNLFAMYDQEKDYVPVITFVKCTKESLSLWFHWLRITVQPKSYAPIEEH